MLEFQLKNIKKTKHRAWLEKLKDEQGVDVKAFDDEPELYPESVWLYKAFTTLSGQRIYSEAGPMPIQFSEIHAYANLYMVQGTDQSFLAEVVIALDKVYMELRPKR